MSLKVTFFLFTKAYNYSGELERMKIYLDIVFFVNFGINLLFSMLILTLFNEKHSYIRLIISSICAGIIIVTMVFDIIIYNFFKICGGFILTFIGMGAHRFLLKSSVFYLLHFALTGIVASFSIRHFYLIGGIIVVILLIILENFRRKSIFPRHLKYNISVTFNEKKLDLKGFLDTGNFVCFKNIPIIFIDQRYYQKGMIISEVVYIKTVEQFSKIDCYLPKSFIIKINKQTIKKEVYVAFSNLDIGIDCLLNYHLIF